MKRILLTGLSGVGKSTVIGELAARGYKAIDTDYDGISHHAPNGEWIWNEERIQSLLSTEDADILFFCGCSSNQGKFYSQLDHVILFSAPIPVITERLRTRTNPYGKTPEELAKILDDIRIYEPRIRYGASDEIDTGVPLDQVVAEVLRIAGLAA